MRRFVLNRREDESGVSGTGVVAEGVEFHNGRVALCWRTSPTSVTVHDCIGNVKRIHGHQGKTEVVWIDEVHVDG